MRKLLAVLFGVGTLTLAGMNIPASAAAVPKATGGVAVNIAPYSLYVSFSAFDGNSPIGQVNYTNFNYPDFSGGSGVWSVGPVWPTFTTAPHVLSINGSPYFNVDLTPGVPTSNNSIPFTGTGGYLGTDCGGPTLTANMQAQIIGTSVTSLQVSWGPGCAKTFLGSGSINTADGSMSGTMSDATDGLYDWAWSLPAGTATQVLHFVTQTTCAVISGNTGEFGYTVPPSIVGPGTDNTVPLLSTVVDNGTPGTAGPDTFTQDAGTTCPATAGSGAGTAYDVVGGNLVVHPKS